MLKVGTRGYNRCGIQSAGLEILATELLDCPERMCCHKKKPINLAHRELKVHLVTCDMDAGFID